MKIKNIICFLILPLPSFLKVLYYRTVCNYEIAVGVRIGFSVLMVNECSIGSRTRIGHFNYISSIQDLKIGSDVSIGHLNIILGGALVQLGDGAVIGRSNEINSIINPLNSNTADPRLIVHKHAVITAFHKIDYTDRITIGKSAIIAGRNSCLWTHNRQQVKPVEIGCNCYVGSGVQFAPGASVAPYCVVGLGAVVTKPLTDEFSLVAGSPARTIKPLDEESEVFVKFPTRPDLDC